LSKQTAPLDSLILGILMKGYLTYLPHLALPLAASYVVIPLEQEAKKTITDKIVSVKKSGFFIKVR
jgi:hypothetical protein